VQFQAQSQQRQVSQQHTNRQRARQTQQSNKLSDITSQSFDLYGVQDPTFMVTDNATVQHPDQVYSQQQQLQSLSDRTAQREQPQFSQAPSHHTLQTLQTETTRPGAQSSFESPNHMMEYVDTDQTAVDKNNQARWQNQQFVGLHTDLQKPLQNNLTMEATEDELSGNNSSTPDSSTPKVKRPMNAFLIFSVKRRRELSSQNPTLATSEISTILGDEWAKMDADLKNNFILQAQMLKNNFDREHPDYVYTRRPNYTRKKRRFSNRPVQDASPSTSGSSISSPSLYYPYGPYAFPPIPFGYQTVPIKQPPNAYLLFNRTTRNKIKNEHPDISVSEVSKRVGEAWKFLPEEEKNKFYEEAKRLRKDFDNIQKLAKAQRESFRGKKINPAAVTLPLSQSPLSQSPQSGSQEVQDTANFGYLGYPQVGMPPFPMTPLPKRRLRAPKDPTQPKHPSSAFLFFLREVRPQYTAKYPKNSLGPISKMISAAWKELSAEDKAKYVQKSEEDKKRYAIEMEMWLEAKKQKTAST
jgi:hypothetical protein